MTRWTGERVGRVMGARALATPGEFSSVSTDTRTLEAGALFVEDGVEFGERVGEGGQGEVARSDTDCGRVASNRSDRIRECFEQYSPPQQWLYFERVLRRRADRACLSPPST